jgi:hypothetical protein
MVLAIGKLPILDIGRMDDAEMSVEPILHAALKLLKSIYVMSVNPSIGDEKLSELATEFWPVQPEPGSVADQLIKKGEAQGKVIGKAIGEAREKANTIRILQSILNAPQSTDQELGDKKLDELQATIEALQQQVFNRPR